MPTRPDIPGLHHITAITGDAPRNLAFYTQVLGLRLVKKTVNQDDVSAYHLFYGDAKGSPGMDLTFFDWPASDANRPGAGSVAAIALAVRGSEALGWWQDRFDRLGVTSGPITQRHGRSLLPFQDPEGQRLELVDASGLEGPAIQTWEGSPIPGEVGIRSFFGVTLEVAAPAPTLAFLTGLLGFRVSATVAGPDGPVTELQCGAGGAGSLVRVAASHHRGRPGIGGVHHVAFRTVDAETQQAWLALLDGVGVPNSGLIDRYYFRSLYFREPGGILFEIATDGPGFATDESADHLGERLSLPPFLEPHRAHIEAGLRPLAAPGGVSADA